MRNWIVRCLAIFATIISVNAYAVAPGFYLGLDAGAGNINGKQRTISTMPGNVATPNKSIFTAGGYMGYLFIPYIGGELGANYFTKVNYKTDQQVNDASPSLQFGSINLLGVGVWPLGSFKIFGKAGLAIIFETVSKTLISPNSSPNKHGVKPMFGLGAGYDLTQNWVVDFSWNQIQSVYLAGNVNFFALSFSYHFVNKYCGQFLCDD